ncbi:MAG: hypothetical protein H0T04_03085 [Chloroflexi bacterium]|nr:hypothetical protein [Chloroflexota bacterium]
MIPLVAALLAAVGALAVLLVRGWPRGAGLAGAVALSAVTAAVLVAPVEAPVALGESQSIDAPLIRLWLSALAGSLALIVVVAMLVAPSPGLPLLACVLVTATALSLTIAEPATALTLAAATGVLALAGAGRTWQGAYRQAALVPGIALAAVLLASLAAPGAPDAPGAAGSSAAAIAALLVVGAVALRVGVVPLHLLPLRAARTAPLPMIPLTSVWAPYLFGLLAAAWLATGPVAGVLETAVARDVLAIIGSLTIVLAALAMLVQDDLGSLLSVHAIGDGALVVLALAGGAAALPALILWLIVSGLARTALAAWSLAVAARMGGRRISEIRGWIERAPLLLSGLLLPVVAGLGWPGSPPFEARLSIVQGVMPGEAAVLVAGASMALALGYLRLAWAGIGSADAVSASPAGRRRRAARWVAAGLVLALGAIPLVVTLGLVAGDLTGPAAAAADWRPFAAP